MSRNSCGAGINSHKAHTGLPFCQTVWHAVDQPLQKGMRLALHWESIRIQELRHALPVLCHCQVLANTKIVHLTAAHVTAQMGPHILDGIQVAAARWEAHRLQAMIALHWRVDQEALIVVPHL